MALAEGAPRSYHLSTQHPGPHSPWVSQPFYHLLPITFAYTTACPSAHCEASPRSHHPSHHVFHTVAAFTTPPCLPPVRPKTPWLLTTQPARSRVVQSLRTTRSTIARNRRPRTAARRPRLTRASTQLPQTDLSLRLLRHLSEPRQFPTPPFRTASLLRRRSSAATPC